MKKKEQAETKDEALNYRHTRTHVCAFCLKTGPWKNLFPDEQNKIIIARALNYCKHHDQSFIAGYIITDTGLCLVLYLEWEHIDEILHFFKNIVTKEIKQHLEWLKSQERTSFKGSERPEKLMENLFTRYPLYNYDLIKLLIGREVELPYDSPCLARLKDSVYRAGFCSAIDYSGAKSPVDITKLDKRKIAVQTIKHEPEYHPRDSWL